MSRGFTSYELATRTGADAQVGAQSAGAGTVITISGPTNACAMMIQAKTTAARLSFDNTAPGATNAIILPAGTAPVFFPFVPKLVAATGTRDLLFDGDGGVCDLTVIWLE